ncbi:D-beta-hydroxybutyrate dehydrogenase [Microbacterium esteraromaticum]|uniref:D-beta-hydroxybutyrate dehydrogenase n=1 Tax=Microbacterium esteraromaticum TaxID=57043 RepID=A0A1R4JL69_9MICO|nr:3-hydroxybutyrate dehydrogenase [Microbacterium esteraromaticum]SJN32991.1 D-beta-hydroxybutyrate dehydrogenase [Microbacterium esteraromaticum]
MTEQDLTGRRAVITGGASGIGFACAQEFSRRGAHVIIADLNGDAAQTAADEVGGEAWVVDLSDTQALDALALDADILVNNAGIQRVSPIVDFDPDAFRLIQRLMLEAPFLLMRAVLPGMYDRGWGRIVNISSVHGLRASAFKSAYVAAKHGMEGLSKTAALEGGSHGVTSNCINPGYVRTPLVEKQIADQARLHSIPESEVVEKIMLTESAVKRLVEASEVASLAGWLVSDAAGMVTGASYTMDGGWSAR